MLPVKYKVQIKRPVTRLLFTLHHSWIVHDQKHCYKEYEIPAPGARTPANSNSPPPLHYRAIKRCKAPKQIPGTQSEILQQTLNSHHRIPRTNPHDRPTGAKNKATWLNCTLRQYRRWLGHLPQSLVHFQAETSQRRSVFRWGMNLCSPASVAFACTKQITEQRV